MSDDTTLFRGVVQACSEVAGRGTVVVVQVQSGDLKVGDQVHVIGAPERVADVIGVEAFAADDPEEDEEPVRQLGLLLTGVSKADVPRGSGLDLHAAASAPEG